MRVRVRRLLPVLESNPLFEDFQQEVNATSLSAGLDGGDIIDDEVYIIAYQIWQDIMNGSNPDENEHLLRTRLSTFF